MFPHTVTVYNIEKDSNNKMIYNKRKVENVFYNIKKIISDDGKGEKYTYAYDVIFSNESLKNFVSKKEYNTLIDKTNYFTLKENDIVVLDEFGDITDLKDVQIANIDYFLIKTISDNRYGEEELKNIEITN